MVQFENAVDRYNEIILKILADGGVKCWLAGGCLRDYFMGVPVKNDYDLFFPDEENRVKAEGILGDDPTFEVLFESDNAKKVKYKNRKYDLIKKYFPGPQETINEFDFTASMLAIDGQKVYHGPTTFIDLAKRQLMLNKLTYPASTMERAFRYYQKGFKMCKGEMKKLVEAIQAMPKPEEAQQAEDGAMSSEFGGFFNGID